MPKRQLKRRIRIAQGGVCALSGEALASETSLVDTDRIQPKADGGTYVDENTRIVEPTAHMARHGTLRTREEQLDALKAIIDDRTQVMRLKMKINNQLLAYERHTDRSQPETVAFLTAKRDEMDGVLADRSRRVELALKAYRILDPLVNAALNVPNVGPMTVALLTVYVDLAKANSVSSLWKYAGLHCASHERYTKGKAGGGNKTLRSALWNAACVMMKDVTSPYRDVYDRMKNRLSASDHVVRTRNTEGRLVEAAWKDAKPSHRHGAALRAVMKHILADYWFTGRSLLGLPTRPLYVEEQLGHNGIVRPRERGWKF